MTLHHRFDGPADAPVVVLGPSLGTTAEVWAPQLPALCRSLRVLRYDLPGHGGSPATTGVTVPGLAAELLGLLDRYGLGTVAYAGVSMGGAVGTALAVTAPDRISALALVCTAARFGSPDGWRDRAALVRREGLEPLTAVTARRWFTPAFDAPEPYLDMLRGTDPEGYAACCEALAGFDLRDRLGEVRAATLVIAGEDDPATPPDDARILAGGIPGARLLVVPGAAHLAHVERPDVVTDALVRHLAAGQRREEE
ncbi:3-oxoadipate enol-lactonase [Microbispora sp. RL4-1S]|uniref:3-oxoadipate enol-lactonase n=1 Tax=Microbispora oryzae TaxID=2806554 RepID=A0A940WM36_9ACTN|nr:3-oxoadipate enol-lactonase [Microbispora oryzae]MBP2703980.1 3-oxoadipate enol-lactonase [Microbispora oryzae]